ncbi:MAG: hypothetical protein DLM71_10240 [Chloroflexi bacterium]|nr:MAG: hypothetical protein DLM71_10240 [Chloroflexota bacterium]
MRELRRGAASTNAAGEERKLVTILFADVTSSTELGDQLDPERLRILLQQYFAAMSAVIGSWGGTIEKYIGDAIMAVFGVPQAREDDAARALHSALEMLERLEAVNRELLERHGVKLRVRIGVNSGEVIAPIAAAEAGQFLVSGDAVNVAARLEQAAEPNTIVVGERTYLAARHAFTFGEPMALELRGKPRPVAARTLLGALPEAERGLPGLQASMVGRDRELVSLLSVLDDAVETGQPRLVVIYGPAGIGKSRLVRELVGAAEARPGGVRILRGRCLAAGHGITFWALGEWLRAACDISLQDPVELDRERLRDGVNATLAALTLTPPEAEETLHALATTANIDLPGSPLDALPPRDVAEAMARAWPRFAAGLAAREPTVLIVEDLHWADDQMLELLGHVAKRARGPIVLVTTARPEFAEMQAALAANAEAISISLRPLTDLQSRELVDELLNVEQLPEQLRAEILARAEGNPFFVEEILRRLIDEAVLVRRDERWVATSAAAEVKLPDSIQALLAARIDGLPGAEKRLLQEAAVVGRVFWPAALLGVTDGEHRTLLDSLERRGLVVARPTSTLPGQTEYLFRHALIRDVAYASVPRARRASAHADVAEWMERLTGERIDEVGELLAYHYRSAVAGEDADLAWVTDPARREAIRRRALETLLHAGADARRRYATGRAVALHEQALDLADGPGERARVLEELGDDHDARFRGDEALDAYQRAIDAAREAGTTSSVVPRAAAKAAGIAQRFGAFRVQPDPARLEELVDEGLETVTEEPLRARLLASRASMVQVWMGSRLGRESGASAADPMSAEYRIAAADEALRIAARLDLPEIESAAAEALMALYWANGRYDDYQTVVKGQLDRVSRLPSERQRAQVRFAAAMAQSERGALRDGLATGLAGLEMARSLSPHEMMHASFSAMLPAFHLGEWDRVQELFGPHLEAERREGDVLCSAVRGGPLLGACVLAHRGDTDGARRLVPPESYTSQRAAAATGGCLLRYAEAIGDRAMAEAWLEKLAGPSDSLADCAAEVACAGMAGRLGPAP